MLKNLRNMNGVTVLGKKEQKNVKGGMQRCYFTLTVGDKTDKIEGFINTHGPGGSAEANDICVEMIVSGQVKRCKYDCEYDGFGQ